MPWPAAMKLTLEKSKPGGATLFGVTFWSVFSEDPILIQYTGEVDMRPCALTKDQSKDARDRLMLDIPDLN